MSVLTLCLFQRGLDCLGAQTDFLRVCPTEVSVAARHALGVVTCSNMKFSESILYSISFASFAGIIAKSSTCFCSRCFFCNTRRNILAQRDPNLGRDKGVRHALAPSFRVWRSQSSCGVRTREENSIHSSTAPKVRDSTVPLNLLPGAYSLECHSACITEL